MFEPDPNPFKTVERIGRICYKSEDAITEDSYKGFCERLIKNQHFAMLEHGHVHVAFEINNVKKKRDSVQSFLVNLASIPGVVVCFRSRYEGDEYSIEATLNLSHIYNPKWSEINDEMLYKFFSTIRHRLQEYGVRADNYCTNFYRSTTLSLKPNPFDSYNSTFKSLLFQCDRGISHELVRHRQSVAQSSTRYCNYSKGKFGGEISYCTPVFWNGLPVEGQTEVEDYLKRGEDLYMRLINHYGVTPENARDVLPHLLSTEVVLTMNIPAWMHFVDLRADGTTGKPHPDMEVVAKMAKNILNDATEYKIGA